jgi:homogentisate 1,2-dioxygenase
MIDRMSLGEIPDKPHTQLRAADGTLRHEHCLTRVGFDGPFTIAYRAFAPHVHTSWGAYDAAFPAPVAASEPGTQSIPLLLRRLYQSQNMATGGHGTPLRARMPLLFSDDVVVSVARPDTSDTMYFSNGDGDDLVYVHAGGGTLITELGDVRFEAQDYVFIPRGIVHRFELDDTPQHWFVMEALNDLHIPHQFRNPVGQLRMDAPYTHRDFRRPVFKGVRDEGIRDVVTKRQHAFTRFTHPTSPLDVVGWDGTVWPWAFPILAFQPKTSTVHLPPTIHGTFAIGGGLVCSFVPRLVDYHPEAIPCPYPHSSVHADEAIFYADGHFTSRKGVDAGSISHHPMGTSHGPHPGAYEASIGHRESTELAVMLDVFKPLQRTAFAQALEDSGYHASFNPEATTQ